MVTSAPQVKSSRGSTVGHQLAVVGFLQFRKFNIGGKFDLDIAKTDRRDRLIFFIFFDFFNRFNPRRAAGNFIRVGHKCPDSFNGGLYPDSII